MALTNFQKNHLSIHSLSHISQEGISLLEGSGIISLKEFLKIPASIISSVIGVNHVTAEEMKNEAEILVNNKIPVNEKLPQRRIVIDLMFSLGIVKRMLYASIQIDNCHVHWFIDSMEKEYGVIKEIEQLILRYPPGISIFFIDLISKAKNLLFAKATIYNFEKLKMRIKYDGLNLSEYLYDNLRWKNGINIELLSLNYHLNNPRILPDSEIALAEKMDSNLYEFGKIIKETQLEVCNYVNQKLEFCNNLFLNSIEI